MKLRWKKVLKSVAALVGVMLAVAGIYVFVQASMFDGSMSKIYDVPVTTFVRSTDSAVLARGKHLVESVAPCATGSCHGTDLGGGAVLEMGPLGTLTGPNLTRAIADYSDAELARMLRHGIKRNGRSLAFMPVQDFAWLPDDDVTAIVSYVRTVRVVDRPSSPLEIRTLGKVLDRQGKIIFDVARHIDHSAGSRPKGATPTVEYGQYLAMSCTGCHGERLSGGPLPGAPPSVPTPLNLTPHDTGLKDWTKADFDALLSTGMRKSGKKLDPFMPYEAFGKLDEIERAALWAYLRSVPPLPFGGR